jgi:hypothetical protein
VIAAMGLAAVLALAGTGCAGGTGDGDSAGTAIGGGPDGGGAGDGTTLRLLSYNVAGIPQEISHQNPQANIPLISPRLEQYDLVLTQEDSDWWVPALDGFDFTRYHERLRADTTFPFHTARHPGPEGSGVDPATRPNLALGDGLGIMSRAPFSDEVRVGWSNCHGSADLSDGGELDCLMLKGFARVTLDLGDGALVDVYNLQGESGGTVDDQALQAANFDQLAAYIAAAGGDRAVIVAGDTGLHTSSEHPDGGGGADTAVWGNFLAETGLVDACTAVGCVDTGSPDKVAYRDGGGVTLEATALDMPRAEFRTDEGFDLSDHPPLAVDLDWSTAGG